MNLCIFHIVKFWQDKLFLPGISPLLGKVLLTFLIRKDEPFLQRQTFLFLDWTLATYPEIFALKCKRSNELWLFET